MFGANVRSALAIPVVSPPPPNGMSTASGLGMSSTISIPIVPFPAITRSSATGWTKTAVDALHPP